MRNRLTAFVAGVLTVLAVAALAGCTSKESDSVSANADNRDAAYKAIYENQIKGYERPTWSPTVETIKHWIDTWGREPDRLAYVYLMASNGQLVGYYVTKGPPVSYCASLAPPYDLVGQGGSGYNGHVVPAPAMDQVYYSGGQCNSYYAIDALTKEYIGFSVGGGFDYLLYSAPIPRQDVEPLGFTIIQADGSLDTE